ncbi:hypothetical protein PYCCODRAFT_1440362 [Trametes coccinea BRFM310]|uniref:DUF6533 domain-containing protein n=1 Tax=Trametes coccinea (strain BRFM310) TaxID=1353009 RepID=A0A1Y2IBI8_TRAC3|nr:hypothetical protein PYCCODRAFT_1440362 [Trametes coccinea BRFM310]
MSFAQELSDIEATYYTDTVYQYFEISALTLLGYHYVLPIGEEVEQISRQKFTGSTAIYLANRYLPLAVAIYQWSPVSNGLVSEERSFAILEALQYLVWGAFSALRTYAMQRTLAWAIVILILSLSPMVGLLADLHWVSAYTFPTLGCSLVDNSPTWLQLGYARPLLSRIPLVFADVAVIVITWKTQYKDHKLGAIVARKGRPSLATVLYHNGIKYFVVLTVLNIPQMLMACFMAIPTSPEYIAAGIIQFIEPLTAILVASFLTDLRKAAEARTYQASLASFGSIEFRVVGSLGVSLGEARGVEMDIQAPSAEPARQETADCEDQEGMGEADIWEVSSVSMA